MTSINSPLLNINKQLLAIDGIYSLPKPVEAKVTFVDADEDQALRTISSLDDLTSHSEELEARINSEKLAELLSHQSHQYLYALDFSDIESVLEISADFGGITRYCAEKSAQVDVLKTNLNASIASQYRCSDLTNVSYICESLSDVALPNKAYDLIVLSDLECEGLGQEELMSLFTKVQAALSEHGALIVKCLNPNAVSKQFDEGGGMLHQELYQEFHQEQNGEHSLSVWLDALSQSGVDNTRAYSILPNANHCRTLLANDYLDANPYAVNHFYGAGLIRNDNLNEYLFFDHLSKSERLADVCNGHLILASKHADTLKQLCDYDFIHVSSSGRKRQWRTLTTLASSTEVGNELSDRLVKKTRLIEGSSNSEGEVVVDETFSVKQDLSDQTFQLGDSLAGRWLKCLLQEGAQEQLFQYFSGYYIWLKQAKEKYGTACYDLLPFNLIVDENEKFQIIDPEWLVDGKYDADFIYFRAIFWFVFQNRVVLAPLAKAQGLFSIEDFVAYVLDRAGIEANLNYYAVMETNIQGSIEKQFNQNAITETLRLPLSDELAKMTVAVEHNVNAQLFFYEDEATVDFENSRTTPVALEKGTVNLDIAELDTSFRYLRIDPVDRKGFFNVEKICLRDKTGQLVWSIEGATQINQLAQTHNLVYSETELGNLFVALNDDPQLVFDLSEVEDRANIIQAELDIDYQQTQDYTIAMNKLGNEAVLQKITIGKQRNELEEVKAKYSKLNDNFEFLKTVSGNQHELIQKSDARMKVLTRQISLQHQSAAELTDMLNRKFSRRVKSFLVRKFGIKVDAGSAADESKAPAIHADKLGQNNDDYQIWIKENALSAKDIARIKVEIEQMPLKPTISIVVPVYDIEEEYLDMAVNSVIDQLYPHWQLCLVDDASPKHHIRPVLRRMAAKDSRISIQLNKVNGGIGSASNDGLGISKGDYVGLLDHDDELTIDALYENVKLINESPEVDFIYSDEDKMTMQGERVDPFFKPDFSPDLLESQNYICHFSVFSGRVLQKIGGFRKGFDGSQDHDIIFRAVGNAEYIAHIPKVLYHWRKVPGSTADVYDSKSYAWEAGRRAVEQRLIANQEKAEIELGPLKGTYRVKRTIIGRPKVSIIIPFKDKPELLATCITSILEKTSYDNYEIIGVSNNSEQDETLELMQTLAEQNDNVRFVEKNVPFNFSAICNFGVQQSSGEYVLLLNNDIEVTTEDWIECLLGHAQRPEVGAVGGKLLYPDGRIQHAGVVAGMHGAAGHKLLYFSGEDIGYYGSLKVTSNVSAVTGAMLMVSRAKYDEVTGLDEANLAVAYNDVDFCLKLLDKGYLNVFNAFCCATHHESASRGYEDNPEKVARLEKERAFFVNKWKSCLAKGDPYFNPNFDLSKHDLTIKLKS